MGTFKIIGMFWRGSFDRCPDTAVVFKGDLEVGRFGWFRGTTRDIYGTAQIHGQKNGDHLEFKKIYLVGDPSYKGGSDLPIQYKFQQSSMGGWCGRFTFPEDRGDKGGFAICTITDLDESS